MSVKKTLSSFDFVKFLAETKHWGCDNRINALCNLKNKPTGIGGVKLVDFDGLRNIDRQYDDMLDFDK